MARFAGGDSESKMQTVAGYSLFFFFQAEDGIRDVAVTGVQTCALPICLPKVREQFAGSTGRITNVDPLPKKVLERLYAERDDDEESIRRFIAAQPKDSE